MVAFRQDFPYAFVLMLGDNIYEGPATREDYRRKFEDPYRTLLDEGVKFHAVLGNHDDPRQVVYPLFNMDGERYYSFSPPEDLLAKVVTRVEFFALDSTNLDRTQLRWLDERLAKSDAEWKVCFFHHPLYTSGRYRTWSRGFRLILEPLLIRHGVDVAFSGHEHIYQRSELQGGIQYFVSGGAGSLRPGDGTPASYVARNYDSDYHFMLIEIDSDELTSRRSPRWPDDRRRNVVSGPARRRARTRAAGDERYASGHGGPSLISRTRVLNTRTQSDTGLVSIRRLRGLSNLAQVNRSVSCASVSS